MSPRKLLGSKSHLCIEEQQLSNGLSPFCSTQVHPACLSPSCLTRCLHCLTGWLDLGSNRYFLHNEAKANSGHHFAIVATDSHSLVTLLCTHSASCLLSKVFHASHKVVEAEDTIAEKGLKATESSNVWSFVNQEEVAKDQTFGIFCVHTSQSNRRLIQSISCLLLVFDKVVGTEAEVILQCNRLTQLSSNVFCRCLTSWLDLNHKSSN